jgi:DNA-binding CsgD family transcriptional regulator/tetratricopeptide (TPR) repeat protein
VFVGRKGELGELVARWGRASGGESQIVCVEGPAGIGKTALIHAFLDETDPAVVIAASGDADEVLLPFGVVAQLADNPSALRNGGLAGLGVLGASEEPIRAGRLLLDGLAELQTGGEVVVIVEDLHWVDLPSATAIRFALRRLSGDRVLAVLSSRPGGPADADEGWRRLLADRGRRLRLEGLTVDELAELAASTTGIRLAGSTVRRLWAHTGGNPLYACCLLEELDPDELAAESRSLPVPQSLASLLLSRLAGCGPDTAALVSATAVLGESCPLSHAVALASIDDPVEALSAAVEAGLLVERRPGDLHEVAFTHALVRSAVYSDLSPSKRAALHRAAAALVGGSAGMAHRAAAATGPDEPLAHELVELADKEMASGAVSAAAAYFWQAADLTAERTRREERLLSALEAWLDAGDVHEVAARREHLERLPLSWRRENLRGMLALIEGRVRDGRGAFHAALGCLDAGNDDSDTADELIGYLMSLAVLDWNWQEALQLATEVRGDDPFARLHCPVMALGLAGRGREALNLLDLKASGAVAVHPFVVIARGYVSLLLDDPAAARTLIESTRRQRTADVKGLLPTELAILAEACYRLGALDEALVTAELAFSLLEDTGRVGNVQTAHALAVAATAASARGDWAASERLVAAVERVGATAEARSARSHAAAAGWALAVARDDPDAMLGAATAFEAAATFSELGVYPHGPVLAESLWRSGRLEEATACLDDYESRAERLGRSSALVAAARVRGQLMADMGDPVAALERLEAVSTLADNLPMPLETARFRAAHAQVLTQVGRRDEAVAKLRAARDGLEAIGAVPYRDRVDQVLRRLGERPPGPSGLGRLTPTEAVVARLVASGLSNKQVAQRLVISAKGVEYHLGNVYAKVGVHSRSELPAALGTLGMAGAKTRGLP